jgi:integron integrase
MTLLQRLSLVARRRGMADTSIDAYSYWVRNYLAFCAGLRGEWVPPERLHTADVEAFLNHLVIDRRMSASSQNQALSALVFLYGRVLEGVIPQDHLGKFVLLRSRRKKRVPTVLSTAEVARVLAAMVGGKYLLMARLLYGTGLRIAECCTLRVRDIDLGRGQIIVREGKGDKDRVVMLPGSLRESLAEHLARVESKWRADVARGGGYAPVPDELEHKRPGSGSEWMLQFVFPSTVMRRDEEGRGRRWHADGSALDREVKRAAALSGVKKRVSCHTFRHSFAPVPELKEAGYDIRQVQSLLGHSSLKTTMIYTHVMNKPSIAVTSPLDRLAVA